MRTKEKGETRKKKDERERKVLKKMLVFRFLAFNAECALK
jgi:hypothetical protein